ncbi:MAG: hypothetical protein NTX25_12140 [Proteobacteria bacterium]|nr:hypothetical protein [Pseudomonadota bacterium]
MDAQGWGQYFESIPRDAKELLKLDQNLLFSAHFYDLYADPNKVSRAFASVRQNQIPFIVGEFACEHQPGQSVACSAIMEEASRPDSAFGYIAWSTSGNGGDLSQLNVFQDDGQQWQNLSDWGRILLDGPHGIKATSQPACLFTQSEDAASCGRIKNLP